MPTFGKRGNNQRSANGGSFEMYIKTFKDGQNRITVLDDDVDNWIKYMEHYDHGLKLSYPCAIYEGGQDCVGCSHSVEHEEWDDIDASFPGMTWSAGKAERKKIDPGWGVRDTSPKWLCPVIDPKGYVSVFKIGTGVRDDFSAQKAVRGAITDTEWVVLRAGVGLGTEYTVVQAPGEVRAPKYPAPTDEQISSILGEKYSEALEKYGVDEHVEVPQPNPEPVEIPPATGDTAVDALAAARAHAPTPATSKEDGPFIPREGSVGEVKDFLTENGVEFNPKAARQVLVGLAEKYITEKSAGSDEPPF